MNKKIGTWLPCFSGFYGTIWEPYYDIEIEDINQHRHELGLELIDWDDCEFDNDEYEQGIAKHCTEYVEAELQRAGFVTSIKLEQVVSPKQYNFTNDSINIEVELSEQNIKNIDKALKDNVADFNSYLLENYKSRDGFNSYYSMLPEKWRDYATHQHKLGSVLQFICESIIELDTEDMYDQACGNGLTYATATNYEQLCKGTENEFNE